MQGRRVSFRWIRIRQRSSPALFRPPATVPPRAIRAYFPGCQTDQSSTWNGRRSSTSFSPFRLEHLRIRFTTLEETRDQPPFLGRTPTAVRLRTGRSPGLSPACRTQLQGPSGVHSPEAFPFPLLPCPSRRKRRSPSARVWDSSRSRGAVAGTLPLGIVETSRSPEFVAKARDHSDTASKRNLKPFINGTPHLSKPPCGSFVGTRTRRHTATCGNRRRGHLQIQLQPAFSTG